MIVSYCKFIGYPIIKDHKSLDILDDPDVRKKYLLRDFPDAIFVRLAKTALVETDKEKALRVYDNLTVHIQDKMGGFQIDGWRLKSKSR